MRYKYEVPKIAFQVSLSLCKSVRIRELPTKFVSVVVTIPAEVDDCFINERRKLFFRNKAIFSTDSNDFGTFEIAVS